MINELCFFTQVLFTVFFALAANRLGNGALTAWVAIQALIANLLVLKQITLFGFNVTASDTFAIGSIVGLNFLQEYHGQEEAKKATKICFFFLFFFVLISQLHLLYEPSAYDSSHAAFLTIFSPAPRLFLASLMTFFIVQWIDILLFAFLKKKLPQVSFAARMALSLVALQLLDTVLFSVTGLYGLVVSLTEVIFISFLIKLLAIFSFTSIIQGIKR